MSKRVKLTNVNDKEENEDLKNLLEKYVRRSEELELKENTVLKQMEIMQSAVASLKEWNESRKAEPEKPASLDPKVIEEETRQIREETERIKEEIRLKIIENRLLQEEVNRKKNTQSEGIMEKGGVRSEEVECRTTCPLDRKPSLEFFQEKLQKLKETQKALEEESKLKLEETKKKKKDLSKKIEELEKNFEMNRNLVENLKKKEKKLTT